MRTIDIREAKSSLAHLIKAIELGQEREIAIARDGRAVAKLVPIDSAPQGQRIGIAKGRFVVPESIDINNNEAVRQFFARR